VDELKIELDGVLIHHGILGQRWGIRRFQNADGSLTAAGRERLGYSLSSVQSAAKSVANKVERTAYNVGAQINPRELKYAVKKIINNPSNDTKAIANAVQELSSKTGILPDSKTAMKAIESVGIEKHKEATYDNLTDDDIKNLKLYTNSARYSRSINSYLATKEPKEYAKQAEELKNTLQKCKVDNLTVYRSCALKFSFNGVSKKLDQYTEDELQTLISSMSNNFKGKTLGENRVFSTSTSPMFAIDEWRAVNPTASSYNTYLIINCKNTPGVLADGKSNGKSLVNTKSNQEAILAPNKVKYTKLAFDEERKMFALSVDFM